MCGIEFSDCQHAYTKGKSVETALHDLTMGIEESLNYGECALACFHDIEGAFNNIRSEAIETALMASGNDPLINEWIMKVLRNRKIEAEIGGASITATATRGTPQGGVISPTLWILVMNEALLKLSSMGVKVVAYADDLVILARGKFSDTLSEVMGGALKILLKWATTCGLGVNPQKTETVFFVGNRRAPTIRMPKLCGTVLGISERAKFLGVIFDSKMGWADNLQERVRKAYAALYSCQKLMGKTWGLKPKLIHWIYTAIVRPIVAHGAVVWWSIVRKATHAKYLEKVNRVAALSITGARRTTATAALCEMLDIMPLEFYIQEHALRTQIRLGQNGSFKVRSFGHSRLIHNFRYDNIETDHLVPYTAWDSSIEIEFPSREHWENRIVQQDNIEVYTDGSKMMDGTGSGVYCELLGIEHSIRLKDGCNIFQAEIHAVSEAARLISILPIYSSNITIFIDSQAALKALGNRNIRSKAVSRCRRELQVLIEQHSLKLCWVPGHSNIQGNERADELARKGAEMSGNLAVMGIYPGLDFFYREVHDHFIRKKKRKWDENPGCVQTKALWKPEGKEKLRTLLLMNKQSLRKYVGIITGHINLGSYNKKIGLTSDDLCRWCEDEEEVEDAFHFLCQCPALSRRRFNCFDSYSFQELEELRDINPWKMLKYMNLCNLRDA